jgi:hypothetical protein
MSHASESLDDDTNASTSGLLWLTMMDSAMMKDRADLIVATCVYLRYWNYLCKKYGLI